MNNNQLIIGITHGDINGIGYEIILKSLNDSRVLEMFTPIIYGSPKLVAYYRKTLNINNININMIHQASEAVEKHINLINCVNDNAKIELGQSTTNAGVAALESLEAATNDLKGGAIHGIVTAPINKDNIQSEHFSFPGHTEYLQHNFSTSDNKDNVLMLLVSDVMRVAVVTGHIPIQRISEELSTSLILKKIEILNDTLKKDFAINQPRIAVLGLNPHAGDNGLLGNEEKEVIIPAIKEAQEKGIEVYGTYPSDGFFGAGSFAKFDAVLAMYHDQALIPFKLLAMETGVNYTAGLPVIRTSPDHGTAYDIAGKNTASSLSFLNALYLVRDVYNNRTRFEKLIAGALKETEKENKHS